MTLDLSFLCIAHFHVCLLAADPPGRRMTDVIVYGLCSEPFFSSLHANLIITGIVILKIIVATIVSIISTSTIHTYELLRYRHLQPSSTTAGTHHCLTQPIRMHHRVRPCCPGLTRS